MIVICFTWNIIPWVYVPCALIMHMVKYTAGASPSLILPRRGRQDARNDSAYKKFHVKHDDSRLYKNGVLGRFISCAPLPPLLTPHS